MNMDDIEKIEICLGGDHGKGKFTFVAMIIVRYINKQRASKIFEFQIGQIDHGGDTVELLEPLLSRLEKGIKRLKPDKNGMCSCKVKRNTDGEITLCYGEEDPEAEKFPMELFLIGDLKFLFMVVGRSGLSGHWCLYCKLKKSEWKLKHKEKNSIHCNAELWTIEDLLATSFVNQQADVDENTEELTFPSGVKEAPIWDFIPIKNIIPPVLHILLGIGNDLVNKLIEWLDTRIEQLSPEEYVARNMSLLTHIMVEQASKVFVAFEAALSENTATCVVLNV